MLKKEGLLVSLDPSSTVLPACHLDRTTWTGRWNTPRTCGLRGLGPTSVGVTTAPCSSARQHGGSPAVLTPFLRFWDGLLDVQPWQVQTLEKYLPSSRWMASVGQRRRRFWSRGSSRHKTHKNQRLIDYRFCCIGCWAGLPILKILMHTYTWRFDLNSE